MMSVASLVALALSGIHFGPLNCRKAMPLSNNLKADEKAEVRRLYLEEIGHH